VLPAERIAIVRANCVPVLLRLCVAFKYQKRPALAEAGRRRALCIAQNTLDFFGWQRPALEAAHHAPFAYDILKFHRAKFSLNANTFSAVARRTSLFSALKLGGARRSRLPIKLVDALLVEP